MVYCTCELKIVDTIVVVDANHCQNHIVNSMADTYRLRAWIIEEGIIYNSYRDDTGTDPDKGLTFEASPLYDNQYICDLSSYLLKENSEVLVGVNLFADGVLTNAQGKMRFSKVFFQNIDAAIADFSSQYNIALQNAIDSTNPTNPTNPTNQQTIQSTIEEHIKKLEMEIMDIRAQLQNKKCTTCSLNNN